MEYSFSTSPAFNKPYIYQNTQSSTPLGQYFSDSTLESQRIMKLKNNQTHKEILERDLKLLMLKKLKQVKQRFFEQFNDYFNDLNQKIEKYVITIDLCSLIEAQYLHSEPNNLIPMIQCEFNSLLPSITHSLSKFSSQLRQNVILDLKGKGCFRFQRKIIQRSSFSPLNRNNTPTHKNNIYRSCRSSPRNGFGQIQTSHFDSIKYPLPFSIQKQKYSEDQKSSNNEYNLNYFNDQNNPLIINKLSNHKNESVSKLKIQSILKQTTNSINNFQHPPLMNQYNCIESQGKYIKQQHNNGYVYQFVKPLH